MSDGYAAAGVRFETNGPVGMVRLTRPEKRNAQTPATWAALAEIGSTLPAEVRVVVVTGAGVSFSSGLDRAMFTAAGIPGETSLADLARLDDRAMTHALAVFQRGFSWLRRPELVSIAAVHGHAVGAGFQLALACDLRILASDAQLAMREPSLGLVPDLGGTQPLVEAVGYSRALEICLTGRWVGAAEARAIGLATLVVPPAELDAVLADLVAAVSAAPHGAVTATKALLLAAMRRSLPDQLAAERASQVARIRALAAAAEQPPPPA